LGYGLSLTAGVTLRPLVGHSVPIQLCHTPKPPSSLYSCGCKSSPYEETNVRQSPTAMIPTILHAYDSEICVVPLAIACLATVIYGREIYIVNLTRILRWPTDSHAFVSTLASVPLAYSRPPCIATIQQSEHGLFGSGVWYKMLRLPGRITKGP